MHPVCCMHHALTRRLTPAGLGRLSKLVAVGGVSFPFSSSPAGSPSPGNSQGTLESVDQADPSQRRTQKIKRNADATLKRGEKMELTCSEIMDLTGTTRSQVSRYSKNGKIERSSHGHYSAASLAGLERRYIPRSANLGVSCLDVHEERELWLVMRKHAFRRQMEQVLKSREHPPARLTPKQNAEIGRAAAEYTAILSKLNQRG